MNRITRRRAAVTVASMALLATSGLAATPGQAAPRSQELPRPTARNLATAPDLSPVPRPGRPVGKATTRKATRLPARFSLCQQPTRLGQRSIWVRDFKQISTTQVVLDFRTTKLARAARDSILDSYRDCVTDTDTNSTVGAVSGRLPLRRATVRAAKGATVNAIAADASRRHVGKRSLDFEDATVVQVGNRLTWLVVRSRGEDHNCATLRGEETVGQCGAYATADALAVRLARR
ncbi:hypothetical protein AAEX63_08770 [Luteococcus sp. H138]|uniref:hypothetical protein n=1 Tax=unclassified Luteococcus TaxID=2639923 RepID=UPI00313BF2C8